MRIQLAILLLLAAILGATAKKKSSDTPEVRDEEDRLADIDTTDNQIRDHKAKKTKGKKKKPMKKKPYRKPKTTFKPSNGPPPTAPSTATLRPTTIKDAGGDCRTTYGQLCIFPFKDGNTEYNECKNYEGKHFWCATSVYESGKYKGWGYCPFDKSCPHEAIKSSATTTVTTKTTTATTTTTIATGTQGTIVSSTVDPSVLILDVPCLPGVNRFASSMGHNYYYECQLGNEHPILKKCLENQLWNGKTLFCEYRGRAKENTEANKDIVYVEPVLGRPVLLGDLYDSRRELIMNGYSLWDYKKITESKIIKHKFYSNTNFFAEKTQNERLEVFDLSASLKLSFLSGLVTVEGSAHYLKMSKASSDTVRYNMEYDASTRTETLPMSVRQDKDYNICKEINDKNETGPTHVVTSIEYGMKAIFVFQSTVTNHEDAQVVEGDLKVAIKSIPSFSIEGEASANITDKERNFTSSIDVNFFGDFIVEDSPTTYEGAIAVYTNISHYLGEEKYGYNKSSPIRIMLTPIDQICSDVDIFLESVSANLMTVASKMMTELNEEMAYVDNLQTSFLSKQFVDVSQMIGLFNQNLTIFKVETETKLKDLLPTIRSGAADGEIKLHDILTDYRAKAFNYYDAMVFLKERDRELSTINFLFNDWAILGGHIEVGDLTLANINGALLQKEYVIIYWFRVLSNVKVTEDYLKNKTINRDTWYHSFEDVGTAGNNWRQFRDFAVRNKNFNKDQVFFIKLDAFDDTQKISQISVTKNGKNETVDFNPPTSPPKPKIKAKSGTSVTLILGEKSEIGSKFVHEMFVKYTFTYKLSGKEHQHSDYQNASFNINDHSVNNGSILAKISMPFVRSIQITEESSTPAPTPTPTPNPESNTTTAPDNTTKPTTAAPPIETTVNVSVSYYTLVTGYQTPFGIGSYSDPLTVHKPSVAEGGPCTTSADCTFPYLSCVSGFCTRLEGLNTIVITGGKDKENIFNSSEIISYTGVCKETDIPPLPKKYRKGAGAWIRDKLIFCGEKCWSLYPGDTEWSDICGPGGCNAGTYGVALESFTLTAINSEEMLAVGGILHISTLSTVWDSMEVYSFVKSSWETLDTKLPKPRCFHCSILHHNGTNPYLIVIGGSFELGSENPTDSVIMIDLKTWAILNMTNLPEALLQPGCISQDGFVYISGGLTKTKASKNVYRYNFETNKWIHEGTLNTPRYGHIMGTTVKKQMVVAGGFNEEDGHIASIEDSSDSGQKWSIRSQSLQEGRSNSAMAEVPIFTFTCN